jgi:DNA-binding transcriptional ArsR family regulator
MDNSIHIKQVAIALNALGHEARLSLFKLLICAGDDGLKVGEIEGRLNLPASTLSFHLKALVLAGLVIQERRGREVFNRPNFAMMTKITEFLINLNSM